MTNSKNFQTIPPNRGKKVQKSKLLPAYQIPSEDASTYKDTSSTDSKKKSAHPVFDRKVSEAENNISLQLLHVLDHIFKLHGIEWCLMYGTLAGQLHFHGIVPWDDDWDVIVFATENRVKKVMANFVDENPQFGFSVVNSLFSKIYRSDSPSAGSYEWRWPFIDLFYANIRKGKVYSYEEELGTKADFLPLRRGYFGGLLLPIPKKAEKVIEVYYKHEFGKNCKIGYDHRNEQFGTSELIKCNKLMGKYGWVERKFVKTPKSASHGGMVADYGPNDETREMSTETFARNGKVYHQVEIQKNSAGEESFIFVRYR